MKISAITFEGWQNCICIENGGVKVVVSTIFGFRIVGLFKNSKVNHLMLFNETKGTTINNDKYYFYGGHRLWRAPEIESLTYAKDNVKVSFNKDECLFITEVDSSNIIKMLKIDILDNGDINLSHTIKNMGEQTTLSVWGITQLEPNGLFVCPQNLSQTKYISNGSISLWQYGKMNDARVYWGEKYVTVLSDNKTTQPFKFGSDVENGYCMYFNFNQLFVKKFSRLSGSYPNGNCNFECYVNDRFLEMETLSPLVLLKNGEAFTATEVWQIFDNVIMPSSTDEKAIDSAVKKYVKQ